MASQMTFDRFRASARVTANLATDREVGLEGYDYPGRVYPGGYWIAERPATGWEAGRRERWYLILGSDDWLTDDLGELEARLYLYALDEDEFDEPNLNKE